MSISIITIKNVNLEQFAELLYRRNRTLKAYTFWKYGNTGDDRFRGVLATNDGAAVGCFGIVPKELVYPDGSITGCGWFADWYVTPEARGKNIGEIMLQALSDHESIVFGHPGPQKAQAICQKNDYQSVGFHARRRLVLRRWSYHRKRGSLFPGISSILKRKVLGAPGPKTTASNSGPLLEVEKGAEVPTPLFTFRQSPAYEDWIRQQPVSSSYQREFGQWHDQGCLIKYFDEILKNGERRRSVLYISGENCEKQTAWEAFLQVSQASKQDYIEIFTTNRKLDQLLYGLGALQIHEPPIVVRGLYKAGDNVIQAWDRENWTFLADG